MLITESKRRLYPKIPASLPIDLTVKHGGNTFTYRLNAGEKLTCPFCGTHFDLLKQQIFRYKHPYDDNVKIQCPEPECRAIVDAVYYASRKNRTGMKCWDSEMVKTTME